MKDDFHQIGQKNRAIQGMEHFFFISGIALLGIYAAITSSARISSNTALADFKAVHAASRFSAGISANGAPNADNAHNASGLAVRGNAAKTTVAANRNSGLESAIGILKIARLHMEVPIFEGTDDLTLQRGAGHITGTDVLGGSGNTGIAAHRDSFFRDLNGIAIGDEIELFTPAAIQRYEVRNTTVVEPTDTGVLAERGDPTLTLVTCFPFYFVGSAPKRFIVWATLLSSGQDQRYSSSQLIPEPQLVPEPPKIAAISQEAVSQEAVSQERKSEEK